MPTVDEIGENVKDYVTANIDALVGLAKKQQKQIASLEAQSEDASCDHDIGALEAKITALDKAVGEAALQGDTYKATIGKQQETISTQQERITQANNSLTEFAEKFNEQKGAVVRLAKIQAVLDANPGLAPLFQ